MATYVGLGAGDKMITEACIEIGKLAGEFTPVPAPDEFDLIDDESQKG